MTHTSSRVFATMLGRGSGKPAKPIAKAEKAEQLELDMTRVARIPIPVTLAKEVWRKAYAKRAGP